MPLQQLTQALQTIESQTHKLIIAERASLLDAIVTSGEFKLINLSECLAKALLPLSKKDRIRRLQKTMEQLLKPAEKPLVIDRIELLFEPSLGVQLLPLLKQLSRYTTLTVLWPGTIKDSQLTYAQPMHSEYQNYSNDDLNDILVISPTLS